MRDQAKRPLLRRGGNAPLIRERFVHPVSTVKAFGHPIIEHLELRPRPHRLWRTGTRRIRG
jgi:hypothetical protein